MVYPVYLKYYLYIKVTHARARTHKYILYLLFQLFFCADDMHEEDDAGKQQHEEDDAGKQQHEKDPSSHTQRRAGVRRAERDEKYIY